MAFLEHTLAITKMSDFLNIRMPDTLIIPVPFVAPIFTMSLHDPNTVYRSTAVSLARILDLVCASLQTRLHHSARQHGSVEPIRRDTGIANLEGTFTAKMMPLNLSPSSPYSKV